MKRSAVLLAFCAAAVPVACGTAPEQSAPTTDLSSVITTTIAEDVDDDATTIAELTKGDCFIFDDPAEIVLDQPVDCTTPHDAEVIALLEPGVDEIPDDTGAVFYPMCVDALNTATETELGTVTGLLTAYTLDGSKGSQPESDLACFSITRNKETLVGSVFVEGPSGVLDGWKPLDQLDPGDCFNLGDQTNIGLPVDCDKAGYAFVGSFDVDADEYPGEDAMRAEREVGCDALFESSGVPGNPDEVSGTFPDLVTWTYTQSKTITCDVPVGTN